MGVYHHIYMNNPTAGAQDGTAISENGAMTAPLSVTLDAASNESKIMKLAIRCEEGYETIGDTVVAPYHDNGDGSYSPTGGNVGKWQLAKDLSQAGTLVTTITANAKTGDKLTIGDVALTAGADFEVGSAINDTAANIAKAINAKSTLYKATVSNAVITVLEKIAGAGHNPTLGTISRSGTGSAGLAMSTTSTKNSSAADENTMKASGNWASSLTISDSIGAGNVVFWVKASASSNEAPQKDASTVLYSIANIQAV